MYKIDNDVEQGLNIATQILQDQSVQRLFQPMEDDQAPTITIERDSDGRAIRAVVTIVSTNMPHLNIGASQSIINAGEAMPYIRLPVAERPDVNDSVHLHHLSKEQEFAFRLIMKTLQQHIDKERDIPQLTMSVFGNAGKSYVRRMHESICHLVYH